VLTRFIQRGLKWKWGGSSKRRSERVDASLMEWLDSARLALWRISFQHNQFPFSNVASLYAVGARLYIFYDVKPITYEVGGVLMKKMTNFSSLFSCATDILHISLDKNPQNECNESWSKGAFTLWTSMNEFPCRPLLFFSTLSSHTPVITALSSFYFKLILFFSALQIPEA
jgi:hypothetical protein